MSAVLLAIIIVCLNGAALGQPVHPASSCQDLDTQACILFQKVRPDLCYDPNFADSTCRRFCGKCPLECYYCPSPVLNPNDCNTTVTCGLNQTCVTKHLRALDGHDEYIMTCELKDICEGRSLGFPFGKRDIMFDEESEGDIEDHGRNRRDVSLLCCETDFCNFPIPQTTLPPTSPGPFPYGCNRDIVFVLDDSGSVGVTNFQKALNFTKSIVQQIEIGPTKAQVSLVAFSSHPQIGWYLDTFQTKTDVLNATDYVRYIGGVTHTNEALNIVRTQILNTSHGDRPLNENVVLVLTDGQSNDHLDTIREANRLHTVSQDVISIVIGAGIDMNEINAIATDRHHVIDIRSYQNLSSILQQIMQIICNE